jgi:hypothetical protein
MTKAYQQTSEILKAPSRSPSHHRSRQLARVENMFLAVFIAFSCPIAHKKNKEGASTTLPCSTAIPYLNES